MSLDDSTSERVRTIMADIFQLDSKAIGEDCVRESVPAWDSANHLTLILALEEEFGVTFDVSEIETMFSLKDIVTLLEEKV